MKLTSNLNLKKPEATDNVNIDDLNGNADILDVAVAGKVDKVAGKGLSTEDYTTAEKSKLAGIAAGAQVNTVTSVAGKTGAVALVKSDVGLGNVENYGIATQAEAEVGTVSTKVMTPQRTAQAIAKQTSGLGNGDMLKSIYDINNNGKIDKAEIADSVPWSGVSDKPSTFPPAEHQHSGADITSGTVSAARLPAASTSAAGISQLNNTVSSTSTTQAATANAVKQVNDLASSTAAQLADIAQARYGLNSNAIINGNFEVWQRGTSFSNPKNEYTADRFHIGVVTTGMPPTVTHTQEYLQGDIAGSSAYYRITTSGAGSGSGVNDVYNVQQRVENGVRYLCGAGRKVTLSFYARSSIVGKRIGTTFSQQYGSGGGGSLSESIVGKTFALTNSWKRFEVTVETSTLIGKTFGANRDDFFICTIAIMWGANRASSYGSMSEEMFGGAGTVDIAQVQLFSGETVQPYQPRSFAEELALCQRYYEKSYNISKPPGTYDALGAVGYRSRDAVPASTEGTLRLGFIPFLVNKRTNPTVSIYSPSGEINSIRLDTYSTLREGATASIISEKGFSRITINASSTRAINLDQLIDFQWTADAEL